MIINYNMLKPNLARNLKNVRPCGVKKLAAQRGETTTEASRNAKHGENSALSAIEPREPRSRNLPCHRLHGTTMHVRSYARVRRVRKRRRERDRVAFHDTAFGPAYLSVASVALVVSIYLLGVCYPPSDYPSSQLYCVLLCFTRQTGFSISTRIFIHRPSTTAWSEI